MTENEYYRSLQTLGRYKELIEEKDAIKDFKEAARLSSLPIVLRVNQDDGQCFLYYATGDVRKYIINLLGDHIEKLNREIEEL